MFMKRKEIYLIGMFMIGREKSNVGSRLECRKKFTKYWVSITSSD